MKNLWKSRTGKVALLGLMLLGIGDCRASSEPENGRDGDNEAEAIPRFVEFEAEADVADEEIKAEYSGLIGETSAIDAEFSPKSLEAVEIAALSVESPEARPVIFAEEHLAHHAALRRQYGPHIKVLSPEEFIDRFRDYPAQTRFWINGQFYTVNEVLLLTEDLAFGGFILTEADRCALDKEFFRRHGQGYYYCDYPDQGWSWQYCAQCPNPSNQEPIQTQGFMPVTACNYVTVEQIVGANFRAPNHNWTKGYWYFINGKWICIVSVTSCFFLRPGDVKHWYTLNPTNNKIHLGNFMTAEEFQPLLNDPLFPRWERQDFGKGL